MNAQPTYLENLNAALHDLFDGDDRTVLLGEDVLDPYGGAFKVTKGLSDKHPQRVFTTPICEASITGMGVGLALRGFRPIVEIMFGDFITIAADQIINHAAKFRLMYGRELPVPLVVRTPVGLGRGYGPTHSQSLEKVFLGIPGVTVISPSHFHDPGAVLKDAVGDDQPVLFIEHKLLYPTPLALGDIGLRVETTEGPYPAVIVRNHAPDTVPDVVVVSYGGMSRFIQSVFTGLIDEEIRCTGILPSCLSEPDTAPILEEARRCGRVLVVEEGHAGFGWSQEIAHRIHTAAFKELAAPVRCLGTAARVIPSSFQQESDMMINGEKIEAAIMDVMR